MTPEQQIAYDFDKIIAQYPGFFKGISAYVDDLRKYGTLKQAIADAEKRLATARAASDEFEVELVGRHKALNDDFESKMQAARDALAARENEIAQRVVDGQNEVNVLVKAGQDEAARIVAEGEVARAAVDKRVRDAQTAAVKAETEIATMRATIVDLDAQITARQAALATVEKAITDLRAKIA